MTKPPPNQFLQIQSKIPSSDKPESLSKSGSTSIDENLFDDLPTSKVTSSTIQAMSEEIGVQGLTYWSAEPPRWDTYAATLFTRRQNNTPENEDGENVVLPLLLIYLVVIRMPLIVMMIDPFLGSSLRKNYPPLPKLPLE